MGIGSIKQLGNRLHRENEMSHSYTDLMVWQKSMALVRAIYPATQKFPREEAYGLKDQLRRAAVCVSSNIAEGRGRLTTNEFRHFLAQARGSMHEIETQLVIASDLKYFDEITATDLLNSAGEVSRMLDRLINSIPPGKSISHPETGNWKLETRK
ncbi:MAG: four helix bundle protein [Terriglobales bacterium]